MSSTSRIIVCGLPAEVVDGMRDRLADTTVISPASTAELIADLMLESTNLLLAADGFDGLSSEGFLDRLDGAGVRRPQKIALCLSPLGVSEVMAKLAARGVTRLFVLPVEREELLRETSALTGVELRPAGRENQSSSKSMIALAAVWARFRDATLARVETLEEAALALLEGRFTEEGRAVAEREAHKLAGSAGTFGFPGASRIARDLERRFSTHDLVQADAVTLAESIVTLRRELEGAPQFELSAAADIDQDQKTTILIVGGNVGFVPRAQMEGEARSMKVLAAEGPAQAREFVLQQRVNAVMIFIADEDSAGELLDLIGFLSSQIPAVPAIVVGQPGSFRARVDASRRGAARYMEQGVSPSSAVQALHSLTKPSELGSRRVLAVDDDPQILSAVTALLEPAGMTVTTVNDPLQFWGVLEEANPDLVILDLDMPHVSGFEICRIIRQSPRWCALPVLVLTARTDAESIQRTFSAGADDYIGKPIIGPELLMRIRNRLERVRLHRELSEVDSLTGVANRRKSGELLQRFQKVAKRKNESFSVAVLDLDKFKNINDVHGHAAGDEVLRCLAQSLLRSLRSEDVVGRWGGEEFVIGFYAVAKPEAGRRLRTILEIFSRESFAGADAASFHATCSGGVAEFPVDGGDVDALLRVADAALYEAKETGRNRVVVVGEHVSSAANQVDVVIIDDDEAVVGLLEHAFQTKGMTIMTYGDGESATRALTGDSPAVRARVILLDVDLPGVNGLDVLRRFAKAKLTFRSKIIMLSGRRGESDILTALDLGATDHVTKPFSIPVLMQKVRAAMHDSTG